MTKRNLLLVCLLVAFGLAATAPSLFAQGTSWAESNNTNYFARSEGDAEGVGTITLTATNTIAGTIAANSSIAFTYNAPIANYGGKYAYIVTVTPGLDACMTTSLEEYTADFVDAVIPSSFPTGKTVNNGVVLTWTCGTTTVTAGETISIQARVMVQGYPNSFDVQGNVRASAGSKSIPFTVAPAYPQSVTLAELEGGEGSTYTAATTITFHHGPEYTLTCLGVETVPGTAIKDDFSLNIKENWPNALTSLSDEQNIEQDANWPTNGSNILITLTGIPTGVTVTAHDPYPCEYLPTEAPDYCAAGALTFGTLVSGPAPTSDMGSQWFWYPIETTNINAVESAYFGFKLSSKGPLAVGKMYQITAQVMLTDSWPTNSAKSETDGEMPYFTLPEDSPFPVVTFIDCRTSLLFPYINTFNIHGNPFTAFGTGVDVANTTLDPFALPGPYQGVHGTGPYLYPDMAMGTATPQSGSCTFYFYPANGAAPSVYATDNIPAGTSFAFDVASQVPGFAGQTGYAIAICGFQNAHGYAEIYDNYNALATTGPNTTLAYLADVLPDPAFYPRSPAGDGLGESAVAPIEVNKFIEKILMNPWSAIGGFGLGSTSTPTSSAAKRATR